MLASVGPKQCVLAIDVVQSMWCSLCGAIHLWAQLLLTTPLLEQTSHPPTRYLVGKTHSNLNQRIGERAPLAQDRSFLQDPR